MSHIVTNLYTIQAILERVHDNGHEVPLPLFATLDNVINEREKAEELRIAMNMTDKDVYYAGEEA